MFKTAFLSLALLSGLSAEPPFELPEPIKGQNGTELRLFAKEPFLRNTVAVAVGEDGKVYATSVLRRKAADLDIRQFRDWVEKDLSLRTIEEKRAFLRSELTPENAKKYRKVGDQNKDGIIDWKDLTVLTDRIIVLEDTDGDGVADRADTYAEGFNTEVTGIAGGLEAWDGNVFAAVEPDILRFRDTGESPASDEREVLASGFSVRLSYAGHNFSGPVVGPDGRLYMSSADKGMHVTSKEGKTFSHPLSGTIARCELDGSNFEVFAYGLRNAPEVAFDQHGNLFGVDNDGDHKGEKERLIYITNGSDHGWRYHWQYRGKKYQPWMTEGLSKPEHPGRPAYSTPSLKLYHDGPAGFAFNPGTALNKKYHNHFFMTGFPARKLYAFRLNPKGASFEIKGDHIAASGVLMVGLDFGPDGALYVADWSARGYELNTKGGLWTFDDPVARKSKIRQETAKLLNQNHARLPAEELVKNLSHPDQRVRMKSQFALVDQKRDDLLLTVATNPKRPQLARIHAIWGLGQNLRRHGKIWGKGFYALYQDPDHEIRAQAARVAGDSGYSELIDGSALLPLLSDSSDRPRFFAALALGQLRHRSAFDKIVTYLQSNGSAPYHRHAGVMGLVGCSNANELAGLSRHSSIPVRLAAVVALRRLRLPEVATFLQDKDPLVVTEAARAIYDDESIPGAMASLSSLLDQADNLNEATIRRALGAALRLRKAEEAARVAMVATSSKHSEAIRLQALELLEQWPKPDKLDSVQGRYQELVGVPASNIASTLEAALTSLLSSKDKKIAEAARKAAAVYGLGAKPDELVAFVRKDDPERSASALRLLTSSPKNQLRAALDALKSKHALVRATALQVLAKRDAKNFAKHAAEILNSSEEVSDRRAALTGLGTLSGPDNNALLSEALRSIANKTLPPELALDVFEAIRTLKDPPLNKQLQAHLASLPKSPLTTFAGTLVGGDPAIGRNLFENHIAAQCVRCHAVGSGGSGVGPNLSGIGRKAPGYLLAALVEPGRDIAPGFGFITITLNNGTSVSGTLEKEDDSQISIRLPEGTLRSMKRADIKTRTAPVSSMPPMGAILSKKELRDILAYLQSLN